MLGVLALNATTLTAQYERRYEVGLFGAFTKYDKAFNLADKIGGGVRFAYGLTPMIGLEVDALFQSPQNVAPSVQIEPLIGSASLIVNALNASRMTVYLLGGYSRLDFGATSPYRFTDGGVHGGAGAKFFMSSRFALRFEARGIYTPTTNGAFGQKSATHLMGSAGLAFFQSDGPPAADADHDRVSDKKDACPDTPLGATVDSRGCPADADSDGVLNGIDACPNTPTGATVDATGCPHDQDGDKVFDGIDQCANTPAGVTVDEKGCPPTPGDSDSDGVNDLLDKCPGTPAGSRVDQFGCLILFEERAPAAPGAPAPARPTLILRGVNFRSGSSVLTRESYAVLDQVAASLIANPEIRIEIAGYTDSTGRKLSNLRLSMGRAGAVRYYLARKGVSPMRMQARGFGASGYIAPNATLEGRAQNRRVELHKLN